MSIPRSLYSMLIFGTLLLVPLACSRSKPDDSKKTAKEEQRETALKKIDLDSITSHPVLLDSIVSLSPSEVSKRLGTYRFVATTRYEASLGKRTLTLREKGEILVSRKGSFSVHAENNHHRSRDLIFVNGLTAQRTFSGPWTLERANGFEKRFRKDVYSAWTVAFKMFKGHLKIIDSEDTTYANRDAVRLKLVLDDKANNQETVSTLGQIPPLTSSDDEKEAWRLKKLTKKMRKNIKRYLSAKGSMVIDRKTKVCLEADFDGQYEIVPAMDKDENKDKAGGTRVVLIHTKARIDEIGKPHPMNLPDETKPPARRKKIVHDRLNGLVDKSARHLDKQHGRGGEN
ncbi:MAG: hypothetical protein GXP49_07100 [Deltaproteobacteria bacterium]|nr:hypothetical protein [Deltaproteobacteria bacterium]